MTGAWIAAYVVLAALVLLLAVVVLGTLRRVVPVLERAEEAVRAPLPSGLRPGSPVPEFVAFGSDGSPLDDTDFVEPTVLLFIGAGCPPCETLVEEIRGRAEPLSSRVIAVARDNEANRGLFGAAPLEVVYHDGSVSAAFQTAATPHAFAISGGIVIDVAVPQLAAELDALAQQALRGGDRESDAEMAIA